MQDCEWSMDVNELYNDICDRLNDVQGEICRTNNRYQSLLYWVPGNKQLDELLEDRYGVNDITDDSERERVISVAHDTLMILWGQKVALEDVLHKMRGVVE